MRKPLAVVVAVLVASSALGQRKAGDFVPEWTSPVMLRFHQNPDGGPDCVSSQVIIATDAGFAVQVASEVECPRNATQANRVGVCEAVAVGVGNRAARVADGGI